MGGEDGSIYVIYLKMVLIETFDGHYSFQYIQYSKLDFSHFQMYIESIKKIDISLGILELFSTLQFLFTIMSHILKKPAAISCRFV